MDISGFYFISKPLFEWLPKEDADFLLSFMRTASYPRKKIIFTEGAYPKGVYLLDKG